jgi:dihydroflavonol-4-reductase|tara:strand:- start:19484 stop:20440 length:957 start_codon:yes stop_codon:yes gene_type:complete
MINKNVLVTGGSGFLGTELVKELLKQGRKVKVYDIKDCKNKNVDFIKEDIRNLDKLMNTSKNIDVMYHLASPIPQSKIDSKEYKEVIVDGTENVLKVCKKNKIKMIHVSSSGIYGSDREGIVKEDAQKKPIGDYGNGKWNAELKCNEYTKKGVKLVIVRPMAIIGPGVYGVFKKFIGFVHKNYPLVTFGDGNNKIQLVSLSDTVDALLLAEKYGKDGEAFNLGSDDIPTVKGEFKALIEYANSRSIILSIPSNLAKIIFKILYIIKVSPLAPEHYYMLDKNSILDNTKAKKILKWKPKKNNIKMMEETYDWYVKSKGF